MARIARKDIALQQEIEEAFQLMKVVDNEYELYFLGINARAPDERLRDLKRRMRKLRELRVNNTALRFKIRTMLARNNTLNMKWLRTMRQIEDGTYRRLKARVDRIDKRNAHKAKRTKTKDISKGIKKTLKRLDEDDGQREFRETLPAGSAKLWESYRTARGKTGEGIEGMNADRLRTRLQNTERVMRERYGASDVRFKVVVEAGKTKVKAIAVKPKED